MNSWRQILTLMQKQQTLGEYNALCTELFKSDKTKISSFISVRELLALDNKSASVELYRTILDMPKGISVGEDCFRLACILENELMVFYRTTRIKNVAKYAAIKVRLQKVAPSGALPVDSRYLMCILLSHLIFMLTVDVPQSVLDIAFQPCTITLPLSEASSEFGAMLLTLHEISAFLPAKIVNILKSGIKI